MPAVIVKVEPAVIDWVIQNIEDNAEIVNTLYGWKNKAPHFREIEDISKTTHIPLGYFFLETPPKEEFPLLKFRTILSKNTEKPSRAAIDTINQMKDIQDWMRSYLIDQGCERLRFVGSVNVGQDKQVIAQTLRDTLQIKSNWHKQVKNKDDAFKFFRRRLNEIGILVMMNGVVGNNNHRKLDIEEFRAFALSDEYAPLIFINANDSQGAKLFSLIHEAVHLFFGYDDFYNDRYETANDVAAIETICNAVAAEIIVPINLFCSEWQRNTEETSIKIDLLSIICRCGVTLIARRARDNGYISKEVYHSISNKAIEQFNEFHSKRDADGGGNYYRTKLSRLDNRFVIALDTSLKEGKTQYTEAYKLTNSSRNTFSVIVDEIKREQISG